MKSIIADVEDLYLKIAKAVPLKELKELKHRTHLDLITAEFPFFTAINPLSLMAPYYLCPGILKFSGIKPNEVLGMNMSFFTRMLHMDDLNIVQQGIRHFTYSPNDYFINTYRLKAKDGNWHWIYGCSKTVTRDKTGQAGDFIISVFYDVEKLLQQTKTAAPEKDPSASGIDYLAGLTLRERQVFSLIVEGSNNVKMGEALYISAGTVQTHKKNLMKKLNIKNTADLVRLAIKHRMFDALAIMGYLFHLLPVDLA